MSRTELVGDPGWANRSKVGESISDAMGELDTLVLVAAGARGEVADGWGASQTDTADQSTAAIEGLTHRRVFGFMSANQPTTGVTCELLFLDAAPLASPAGSGV